MLPTHLWAPYGDVPRGKPIRLATPGLHVQYTHAGDRRINFLSLGFRSQDNYFPRDRKDYESFHSMIKKNKNLREYCHDQPIDWIGPLRLPV